MAAVDPKENVESAERVAPIKLKGIRGALGSRKRLLEVAKLGCYVSIPIFLMVAFALNTENLEWVIRKRQYVVYPPEDPRPPPLEEMLEIAKRKRAEAEERTAAAVARSSE